MYLYVAKHLLIANFMVCYNKFLKQYIPRKLAYEIN